MHSFSILLLFVLPRLLIIFLRLLTNWFVNVFTGWLWLILGVIFAPYTLLWYSVVINWFGGRWELLQIIVLVVAIIIDLFSWSCLRLEHD